MRLDGRAQPQELRPGRRRNLYSAKLARREIKLLLGRSLIAALLFQFVKIQTQLHRIQRAFRYAWRQVVNCRLIFVKRVRQAVFSNRNLGQDGMQPVIVVVQLFGLLKKAARGIHLSETY